MGLGGSCTQLLSGGGQQQHLGTQEKRKKGSGNFSIKRALYLKALGKQQIILMSFGMD